MVSSLLSLLHVLLQSGLNLVAAGELSFSVILMEMPFRECISSHPSFSGCACLLPVLLHCNHVPSHCMYSYQMLQGENQIILHDPQLVLDYQFTLHQHQQTTHDSIQRKV
jgi:hypothetical protein